jgi:endoglucanase
MVGVLLVTACQPLAPSGGPSVTPLGTTAPPAPSVSPNPTGSDSTGAEGPVAINGRLEVCGTQLCNQHGRPIQLRGMSTHGLQWYGWGSCLTDASLDALVSDWGADIVRVSMYVQEDGYETDPEGFTAQAETVVGALVERGVYVLLDWHMLDPGDPMHNLDRARTYFGHMTERFGSLPNVLYEIANEPNGVGWPRIKAYAEQLIPVIRAKAPDGIVIVGTPAWSSFGASDGRGPADVISDPVAGENLMYTFHFYAASHLIGHRTALDAASKALPVFVTEWGSQQFTGDGPNDFVSTQAYLDLMAERKISWTSWNYSDDIRSGAVFEPGTCPGGPFTGDRLKEAGAWVRERIVTPGDDFPVS